MAQVHITEEELAKDLHGVLDKVRRGIEVVVEQNHQAVALLSPVQPVGRKLSEIVARMPKDSTAVMDADFARDVEAAIESHREPLDSSLWD